ncbi:MAG: DegT/DnrJ/EryC1/StrS family aminotransferase, partial [Candidatus Paceibacterota bacterium]
HYFGIFQEDFERIRNLTNRYGVILVEDCAHYFNLTFAERVESKADFAFYSLHKFFPFKDGGALKISSQKLKLDFDSLENKNLGSNILDYDIKGIIEKRRLIFLYLENYLDSNPYIKLFHSLKENDIPHNFPLLIKNNLREKVYFKMQEEGYPLIALYYRLIQPIYDRKDQSMIDLSNSILNLPVHQDTVQDDLEKLVLCFEKVLFNLNQA